MNFEITGKKISSPVVEKKATTPAPAKKSSIQPKTTKTVAQTKANNPPPAKIQTQKQVKKEQIKKEQVIVKVEQQPTPPIVQEQKQQKIQQTKPQPQPQPQPQPIVVSYEVTVRYNHYKEKFMTQDNILKFAPIDEKYGFYDVFKGNYIPILKKWKGTQIHPERTGKASEYEWIVEQKGEYQLTIEQDEQEESKYQKKAYIAPKEQKKCSLKKNARVEELTSDMKKMGITELGSAQHKQMLQQRDLQDILFS